MKPFRAAVIAVAMTLVAPIAAHASTVFTVTWNLPADQVIFGTGLDYQLPSAVGRNRVTLTSTRAFAYSLSPTLYEEDYYHEQPLDGGLTYGYKINTNNVTSLQENSFGFTAEYVLKANTIETKCCTPGVNGDWVPFVAQHMYSQRLWIDTDFAPGADPISVTLTVTALPEPQTWAMMIIGFGMAGGAIRTRRWPTVREGQARA